MTISGSMMGGQAVLEMARMLPIREESSEASAVGILSEVPGPGRCSFQQAEAQESRQTPELEDGQGIVLLECADKGRERRLGELAPHVRM